MEQRESVIVFSGQGTFLRSLLGAGAIGDRYRRLRDAIAGTDSMDTVTLAASVAHYRTLRSEGARPAALVGHGFGELAALVCAGAFTIEQGAEIARRRATILDASLAGMGGMLGVLASTRAAEELVEHAGPGRAAIAADNGPADVVVSGTTAGLHIMKQRARRRGIPIARLQARWPLHWRDMCLPASLELAANLRGLSARRLEVDVYSPILGRYYRSSDDLGDALARHLILPVRFADAIRTLALTGFETFVECGPLRGLARTIDATTAMLDRRDAAPAGAPLGRPVPALALIRSTTTCGGVK